MPDPPNCPIWCKRWDLLMLICLLITGAVFTGTIIFNVGLSNHEESDSYSYAFTAVFIFCLLGLGTSLVYGGMIVYRRKFIARTREECTSTLLTNQELARHSLISETHCGKAPQNHVNYSSPSLPRSTPPPSYQSIPLAVEGAQNEQCQPIYDARRDSRSSSILTLTPEAAQVNSFPPTYNDVIVQSASRSVYDDVTFANRQHSSFSDVTTSSRSHSSFSDTLPSSRYRSRGRYPMHWPLPPCAGAQWLDPGDGGYPQWAVDVHNMYHFMVESEGWISPLMTVSEEDEARRRRFNLIFGHDFFY